MPTYVNVPWMPQWGTFLEAIQRGTEAGLRARQLDEQAARTQVTPPPQAVIGSGGGRRLAMPTAPTPAPSGPVGMVNPPPEPTIVHAGSGLFAISPSVTGTGLPTVTPLTPQSKESKPIFRTVGTQVIQIDPATGQATPIFTGKSARSSLLSEFLGQQAPAAQGAKPAPQVGEILKGHRFLGGDPAMATNWEAIAEPSPFYNLPTGNTFGVLTGPETVTMPGGTYMGPVPAE